MSVTYNKMSGIKIGGTNINNIPSGTSLGNVSLDVTGKSHFTSDILIDGSFNILNINSSTPTSDFNLANNQTTGNINIGTGLTTGLINIGSATSTTTITGATEITSGTLTSVDINSSGLIDCYDVYVNHLLNIGLTTITETGVGDIALNNPTNGGKYIFNADDAGGVSRAVLNLSAASATFYGDINSEFITNTEDITSKNIRADNLLRLTDTLISQGAAEFLTQNSLVSGNYKWSTYDSSSIARDVLNLSATSATFYGSIVAAGATFNTALPTSTLTPSTSSQLVTKTYVDSNFCDLTNTQSIGGSKTFSAIPSCSVAPTLGAHLCNRTYVDSVAGGGGVSLSSNNVWTGTNAFNTSLPTSTLTPSTSTQLTTKTYVDSNFVDKTTAQTIGGIKTFTGNNIYSGTSSFGSTTTINTTGAATTTIGNISASLPLVEIFGGPVNINTGSGNVRSTNIGNATGSTTITGQLTCLGNTQLGDAAADFIVPNGTLTKPFIIGTYASQASFSLGSSTPLTTYLGGTLQSSASIGAVASGTFNYVMSNITPYSATGGLALTPGTYMFWLAVNYEDVLAFGMTDLRMGITTSATLTNASPEATIIASLPNLTCYFHKTDAADAATSDSEQRVLAGCFNITATTTIYPFSTANYGSVVMDSLKSDCVITKIGGP
jgi:hypothetical protein